MQLCKALHNDTQLSVNIYKSGCLITNYSKRNAKPTPLALHLTIALQANVKRMATLDDLFARKQQKIAVIVF